MTPSFSVVLIARNEAKTLPRLVESLKEFRERGGEIILVDTGSTDGTAQWAREKWLRVFEEGDRFQLKIDRDLAKRINEQFIVPGEEPILKGGETLFNYTAARNYAASLAKCDLVAMPDCDEIYSKLDLDKIDETIQLGFGRLEYNFVFAHDEYGGEAIKFAHSKFYDRRRWRWTGIIHEVLQPTGGDSPTAFLDERFLKLEHWQNPEQNRGGYLTGLAFDFFVNQHNDRNAHYFGRELMYKGRMRSAIAQLERHAAMENAWLPERAQSLVYIGDCHVALGEDQKALASYHAAFHLDGSRREPLIRLAEFYWRKDDQRHCAAYCEAALSIPWSAFYCNQVAHYAQTPHELAYWAYCWLHENETGRAHWWKALEYQPRNPKYLYDARFFLNLPRISVVIPTLGREEKLERLLRLIKEHANYPDYEVLVEHDSFENRQGVPTLVKRLVDRSTGDWVMYLGNDCIPEPHFMMQAAIAMLKHFPEGDGLVALNDGYWHGELATHWLASKKLLPRIGGEFFHTGYHHTCCDNELTGRCRKLRKYVWGELAKVQHDHPVTRNFQGIDPVYEIAYNQEHLDKDAALLDRRAAEFGFSTFRFQHVPVVPRHIYTIWLNDQGMPENIRRWIETQKVPGYQHTLITLKNAPLQIPYVKLCVDAKQWVKAADYLRMHYLYENGGIYLDADTEVLTDFDELIGWRLVAAREAHGFIHNGIVLAEKGLPLLKEYLNRIDGSRNGSTWDNGMGTWTDVVQCYLNKSEPGLCVELWDKLFKGRLVHHDAKSWLDYYPPTLPFLDLRRRLGDVSQLKVINVGVGSGLSSLAVQLPFLPFKQLDHIDVWEPYLARAKQLHWKAGNVTFRKQGLESTDLNGYDQVLMFDVLEHLPKGESLKVLKKVQRALVFIPLEDSPRDHRDGTDDIEPQRHLSVWTEEDFRQLGYQTERLVGFHKEHDGTWDALWAWK